MVIEEDKEDNFIFELIGIGSKIFIGGWFVLEGEFVFLVYDDGFCFFYDIINYEVCI